HRPCQRGARCGGRRQDHRGRVGNLPHARCKSGDARAQIGGPKRARGARKPPLIDLLTAPRSISTVRVRYAETDTMGVGYYANFLVWFEVARTDLLRTSGWSYREMENEGVSLPVIESHCEYKQPARYDDEVEIRTTGALLSHVRMRFDYEVRRRADDALLA